MKKTYRFFPLTEHELLFLEMVLMKEMELQSWFVARCSMTMGEEVLVTVQ